MGFLITYSIENFYFHIYHEDFYGITCSGDSVISVCFGNFKISHCNVIYSWRFLWSKRANHVLNWKLAIAMWCIQNAQFMECFSSITSAFPNYLFYRNFLFSHISWRFLCLSNNVLHVLGTRLFHQCVF